MGGGKGFLFSFHFSLYKHSDTHASLEGSRVYFDVRI